MRFFLFLFIAIPIAEMWLLIQVGSEIGALNTIFLVVLTAAVGLALLRKQGLDTLLRMNQRVEQGQLPAGEILEGVALAVGGALLLTPGFITDGFGFICLLPFTRRLFLSGILKRIVNFSSAQSRGQGVYTRHSTFTVNQHLDDSKRPESTRSEVDSTTIEGDFKRED